ncbi:Trace amine-associated receptor 2, partial [Acropora cervicornis]
MFDVTDYARTISTSLPTYKPSSKQDQIHATANIKTSYSPIHLLLPLTNTPILCNGFVIVVVSTKRKLHTTTNAFILSLAVADFCAGFYILPSTHAREHSSSYQNKRMFSSFQYFLFYTSSWNLCLVTADRYFALTRPL